MQRPPVRYVPEHDRLVYACRREGAAIRAEGDGLDWPLVTGKRAQLAPAGDVPKLDRVVIASRGQGAAVRADGNGLDGARVTCLDHECGLLAVHGARKKPDHER